MRDDSTRPPPSEFVMQAAKAHEAELRGFLRARLSSEADVDDVLQKAFLRALEGAGTLRDPSKVRPWLFRLLRHTLIDHRRAAGLRGARLILSDTLPEAAPPSAPDNTCECSIRLLDTLTPSYAAILRRVAIEGAEIAEAADELQISTNNAMVRLSRARQALRERLMEHCGVSSVRACLSCACVEQRCCG